ncbi:acyltransferase [Actinospongicola halichondriae]|uniref:acyltransferase n=1 Tax=Actinospongicola halichondriae TaxID=3236844 RepID=UPI003D57753B
MRCTADPGSHRLMSPAESVTVADSATIESGARIGAASRVWDLATVRSGAVVGSECVLGRGAFIDVGVVIGDRCKIQNHALLYAPAELADGVFVGPSVILTNDRFPRAVNSDGTVKGASDWSPEGVRVGTGASIGAAAVVLAGVRIGPWSMIASNSTVTRDVAAFALVAGSPATRIGWIGRAGQRLQRTDAGLWECPVDGSEYRELDGTLEERE